MPQSPLQLASPSIEIDAERVTPTVEPDRPEPSPGESAMAESLDRISGARMSALKKQFAWEEAKAATKMCKEDFDGAVAHLLDLIKAETEALPLFDRKPSS